MKNKYEIRGDVAVIFLRRRNGEITETIIDTEDLERLKDTGIRWSYSGNVKRSNSFYVYGALFRNGKSKRFKLHRFLTEAQDGFVVDHVNHNTLDNRKCNLRVITRQENQQNRKGAQRNSKSGIRGVNWYAKREKWKATICVNKKIIFVGLFDTVEEATVKVENARSIYMSHSSD